MKGHAIDRRQFLSKMLKTGFGCLLASLPFPSVAAWPSRLFAHQSMDQVLQQLNLLGDWRQSDQLQIQIPENAEDGASVPMQIQTDLSHISSLRILVEKNPTPLILQWEIPDGVLPFLSCRIKMAESCHVWLIAEADGVCWFNKRWVNVMKGGCGTG
ncbi:MAG: hypothetical protein EBR59_04070 [Methylococcaceae bacterium]|nr:hypothetical protein [Methylococcaceae bacterium]